MFLERFNPAEAQTLFKEALEMEPKHPGATYATALLASEGFESQAVEFAQRALSSIPNWSKPRNCSQLALEDNNPNKAVEEADKALKISPEASTRMAVRLPSTGCTTRSDSDWFDECQAINPVYGEAYALPATFLRDEPPV